MQSDSFMTTRSGTRSDKVPTGGTGSPSNFLRPTYTIKLKATR
jgi:hypothetical protein